MYTSGTTAGPKPVLLSYENWQWNAIGSALALGLERDERWLCPMPLAHVGGLSIQLRSAIYATTVLLHGRFDVEAVLDGLMDPGRPVTLVSLVPTMLSRLLDAGLREPPSLRWALLGGGPIAPALLERARAAGVPVAPSYGMTEGCSQIATFGWPLYGFELRIDGSGELLVRGPAVAPGALAPDGWLHTGDLGSLDERGRLTIEGRVADTIVTGGENVAPIEVEAALLEHPAVADAGVLGRADPEWGEAVVAKVVLRPGASAPTPAELRAHCAARLAPFKVPKAIELVAAAPARGHRQVAAPRARRAGRPRRGERAVAVRRARHTAAMNLRLAGALRRRRDRMPPWRWPAVAGRGGGAATARRPPRGRMPPGHRGAACAGGTPTIDVGPATVGHPIPSGFVGLSIEYRSLETYAGSDPGALDPPFVQLLRNLAPEQVRPADRRRQQRLDVVAGRPRATPPGVRYSTSTTTGSRSPGRSRTPSAAG